MRGYLHRAISRMNSRESKTYDGNEEKKRKESRKDHRDKCRRRHAREYARKNPACWLK